MPKPIERLSDVKKNTLKRRGNCIGDVETLLNSRVKGSETKLLERNDPLRVKDLGKALEEESQKF